MIDYPPLLIVSRFIKCPYIIPNLATNKTDTLVCLPSSPSSPYVMFLHVILKWQLHSCRLFLRNLGTETPGTTHVVSPRARGFFQSVTCDV